MSVIEILLALVNFGLAALVAFLIYLSLRWRRFIPYLFRIIEERDGRPGRYKFWPYEERLYSIIFNAERESEFQLSWGAREMLTVPIIEQLQDGRTVDWNEVEKSILKIIAAMREDRSSVPSGRRDERNAVAVIRAFFRRFCNIPPFCSPNDETVR